MTLFTGNLVLVLITMILGLLFRTHPPKERQSMVGYRTRRSKSSQEAWDFSNRLLGVNLLWVGAIQLVVTMAVRFLLLNSDANTLSNAAGLLLAFQVVAMLVGMVFVEIVLRKRFDENGNSKTA